jgi:hypothetical protein
LFRRDVCNTGERTDPILKANASNARAEREANPVAPLYLARYTLIIHSNIIRCKTDVCYP